MMARCDVCFRKCDIKEGSSGACGARVCKDGRVVPGNYGRITSLGLDPIEKKPLSRFCPGSFILSAGSYGCNLFCPFCQNHDISRAAGSTSYREMSPSELADLAYSLKERGNIGVAFTYNEPLVGYEFVEDTARLVKEKGMKNVLVTNGTVSSSVADKLFPLIDAMNIDIKSFSGQTYKEVLGGNLEMTKAFISEAVRHCHVELTALIVHGINDSADEMRELSSWIAGLNGGKGKDIPLHISRFFPRYKMQDRPPTDVALIYELARTARECLSYVYTGNC